jgi:hypothetical protein
MAQCLLSKLKLRERIIEQYDLLEPMVFVGQTAKASPNFEQPPSRFREQSAQRDTLNPVFVVAALIFPELGAVVRAFIITNRWFGFGLRHGIGLNRGQLLTAFGNRSRCVIARLFNVPVPRIVADSASR